jgi:anti-sigma B factor antagonist
MGEPTLTVTTERSGSTLVAHVSGDVDMATGPELVSTITDELPAQTLLLECAGVHFVDSSGLRSLLILERNVRDGGGTIAIRRPSAPLRNLLEITNLLTFFGLDDAPPAVASE